MSCNPDPGTQHRTGDQLQDTSNVTSGNSAETNAAAMDAIERAAAAPSNSMSTFLDKPLPDGDRLVTIEQARQELAAALRGNRGVSRKAADGVMRAFVAKVRDVPPHHDDLHERVVGALQAGRDEDSAASAVEYVSELVGWSWDEDA